MNSENSTPVENTKLWLVDLRSLLENAALTTAQVEQQVVLLMSEPQSLTSCGLLDEMGPKLASIKLALVIARREILRHTDKLEHHFKS